VTVRVLIVDDEALVRSGFRMIMESDDEIEVVGEAGDGLEAIEVAAKERPDVALMDIRMPRMDGVEATRRLVVLRDERPPRVLVVTTFGDDEHLFEALRAGASGFLLKDASAEELLQAVHVVAGGDSLVAPSLTRRLIEEFARTPALVSSSGELGELTARETDVLRLVAAGLSNREIAQALVVSEATIKSHVSHIFNKLDLRDRAQAVVFAYESGLVDPGAGRQP